uniref:Uncharacterized protein n=1 Tax=Salix viminalis TaxID=40686 RepID=A0A6N2MPN0_SALVM
MPVPNKEYELLTNSSSIPMLNSSCVVQPSIMEDYFTSNGQLLTGQKIVGSGKVIEDAVPNGSSSVSLLASEHVRPKSTRQMDTQHVLFSAVMSRPISSKFSTSSDVHSSAIVQDPHSGVPAISWSSNDSDIACFERRFSEQLDVCAAKGNAPPSSDSNPLCALESVSLGAGTSYSPYNHAWSQNLDSDGHDGVSKNDTFWYSLDSLIDRHATVDKSKEFCHDEVLIDKSKEVFHGKPRADQSTCEVSRPDNFQHLKSARAACSNLNPLAPHFFPSCGKQKVNYQGTECEGDDCLTFQKSESSAVCLFSTEQTLKKTVTAGSSSSDQSSITETHCSIDMPVPNKEYELLTNSSSIPMLNSSCVVQPSIMEDYFTSNGQLMTGQKTVGSGKVIEDAVPNGTTSLSLLASEHVISSSSHRVGVSSALSDTHGLVTKLVHTPKLDIQIV